MNEYGTTRDALRRWPHDPAAKHALEEYFDAIASGSEGSLPLLNGGGLDFTGADLSALNLNGAAFDEANLMGVSMIGANLFCAWLNGADIRGADLSRTNLRKAVARNCDARGAILREADLRKSYFDDSDFRLADLRGASFGNAMFDGADLRGADLRHCNFGQNRNSVSFGDTRLAGCRLDGATGFIYGTVDIGENEPQIIGGEALTQWLADHGAPGAGAV